MKKRLMSAFVAVTMFVSVATSNMVQVQAGTLEIEDNGNKITVTSEEPIASVENNCETLIKDMVQSVQNNDWEKYMGIMSYGEREFYKSYFSNDSYTNGIKQITNVSLVNVQELTLEQVKEELLYDEYPILETSEDVKPYLVELDCEVKEENVFFYNGINYYLIVFAKEADGFYKVAQFNRPSSELANNVVEKTLDTTSDNYEKEIAALEVLEYADEGIVINGEGELIENEYKIIEKENVNINAGIVTLAENNYKYHPALGNYTCYSIPTKISVCLNKTGGSKIVTVSFGKYVRNTLPNEWYASWNKESLKAGAYCVKGVAVYHSIKPVNANYMVSQGTQYYVPDTENDATNSAIDATRLKLAVNSDSCIFFPEYGAGTKGVAGTKASGRLLQWGSQYLAGTKGYTTKQILNYYYSGSSCSKSSLKFIKYSR